MDPLEPYTSFYITNLGIGQSSYPKMRSQGSQLYLVVKPFLLLMRLVGRFPYTTTANGAIQTKLCSLWSLYTAVMGGLLWTALIYMYKNTQPGQDSAFRGINSFITAVQGLAAVTVWFEGRWLSSYFTKWLHFQDDLDSCKVILNSGMHRRTFLFLTLLLPNIAAFAFFQSLQSGNMFTFPVFMLLQTGGFLVVFFWFYVMLFIRVTSTSILHHFCATYSSSRQVAAMHRLWLTLSDLSADLSSDLSLSLWQMMFACCVVWITVCYSFIFTVGFNMPNDEDYTSRLALIAGHAFLFIFCSLVIIMICDVGYRSTASLGPTFLNEILKVNFYLQNQETQLELYKFAEAIRLRYPDTTVARYFTIDRQLIMSLLSASVTYLVVLVQFKIAQSE